MKAHGFTLIEILVVLLIVSVMSGVVIANLPGMSRSADYDAEVNRLQVVLEMAREEALMQSSEFGFRPERDRSGDYTSYRFLIYDDLNQVWSDYDARPLQPYQLEEGVSLELRVEGEGFRLNDEDDEGLPPVMLLSSGETTPFDLDVLLDADNNQIAERIETLRADGYDTITLVQDDDR